MRSKKLTPLEILQKQKVNLQAKSDELAGSIENRARYVQQNFVPLLRNSVVESAVSKMSPQFRNFAGDLLLRENKPDTENSSMRKFIYGIAVGITEIAPFFLKGKKGALVAVLLRQIIRLV